MPILNIEDPRAHRLASEIANFTGESLTDVVLHSLEERLGALRSRKAPSDVYAAALKWLNSLPEEPVFDTRSTDKILGYDEIGLPR